MAQCFIERLGIDDEKRGDGGVLLFSYFPHAIENRMPLVPWTPEIGEGAGV